VLDEIPTYLMNGFYDIWSQQLSNYPRYATSWHLPDCEGNCNAIYLPGGLEIARKVGPFMNATILQGGVFKGVDAIQIDSAPGLLARFDPLGGGFAFDIEKECKAYVNPEVISDGMQMCLRQLGYSVAAGEVAVDNMVEDIFIS
jgi:hypothetical protein